MIERQALILVMTGYARYWRDFKRNYWNEGGQGEPVDAYEFSSGGLRFRQLLRWENIGGYTPIEVWRTGDWRTRMQRQPEAYGQLIIHCRTRQIPIRDVSLGLIRAAIVRSAAAQAEASLPWPKNRP